MSGKAYSIKEMKTIVEYLTEHKAYGEIKGRKMWKDLADSNITTRTWQSLKETFLKRILPDIHNPYYKLSLHQIASFRQGYDVETRLNNKLQIRSASQDSNTEGEDNTNVPRENSKDKNENKAAGEDLKQLESDIRASTETLVLEDCYENTEDKDESPKKSLRELITYSEPLTPMLQAVIDDFATDEGEGSNDEPKMQIVELPETDLNNDDEGKVATDTAADNSKSEDPQEESIENKTDRTNNTSTLLPKPELEIQSSKNKDTVNENGKNEDLSIVLSDSDEITKNNKDNIIEGNSVDVNKPKMSVEMTQNSNTTTDTLLPDNQEAFKGNSQAIADNSKLLEKNSQDVKRAKKRANSQEIPTSASIKKRFNKEKQSISDTDTFVKNKRKISNRSNQITFKQNIPEATEEPGLNVNPKIDHVVENSLPEKDQGDAKTETFQTNEKNSEELENPCLKSVSLYAEQFSNSKYTDSETSNLEENHKNEKQNKKEEKPQPRNEIETEVNRETNEVIKKQPVKNFKTVKNDEANKVVVLKSHSDSVSDSCKEKANIGPERSIKKQRDKALANMFGFSSGGVTRSRKSGNNYRKHTSSRNQTQNISSDSSEWTSDTGSEYVSPPRGRKNRQTRKYLKPKSARILSLEEEGGLFVMYGKKIYPVVKDGKIIKNYVTYSPDNEYDQEESFWKLKYVEEKKRTAELTKLLNQVKDKNEREESDRIPALPTTSRNQKSDENPKKYNEVVSDYKVPIKGTGEQKVEPTQEEKTVKIKFTKNNEEVQLEGHWTHVNPVLAQVIQLLQKDPEISAKETKSIQQPDPDPQVLSGEQTPVPVMVVDKEVHEKVNQIESEIFKEIEEREKVKSPTPKEETPQTENNITKRKGRPKRSQTNTTTEQSPTKKPKVEETEHKPDEVDTIPVQNITVATRRTTRTPKKPTTTDKTDITEDNIVKTRQTAKKSLVETPQDSQEDVRYKFPSPPTTRKSYSNKTNKVTKNTRQRKSSSLVNIKTYSSPENLSLHSIESNQGYIDSDESPLKTYMRRNKRTSFTLLSYRSRSQTYSRKKSHPYFTDDITSESSNSFQGPLKSMTFQNSTLKSDVYKSESYQFLMNENVTLRNKSSSQLEKIEETSPLSIDLQYISDQITKGVKELQEKENLNTDSSSNVTLPTSPVLSIVENISINKSLLNNSNKFSFEDELPKNDPDEHIMLNEFMKTEGDVSMPLMEQEYGIESSEQNGVDYHYNLNVPKTSTSVSESLLNKVDIFNIKDPNLSDSIHSKLRDLILDSAKKKYKSNCKVLIETNTKEIANEEKLGAKVTKSKKRSSTPRKRQSTRKSKLTNTEPCIEEEHMETCSYTSRKSCPPMIQIFEDLNVTNETNSPIQIRESNTVKLKGRKKRDVIKVKISKPKSKVLNKETVEKRIQDVHGSIQTDSGINDTESSVFLNSFNNSVDLIHNHSETCLNANECLGDSVEIIQNATKSIISLDSKSNNMNDDIPHDFIENLPDELAHELFSNDAQDVSVLQKVIGVPEYKSTESVSATVYHTPLGSLSPPDSLITEDLSSEAPEKTARNTKWYLLSEDEISNTNIMDINQNFMAPIGYGANLNEIFPITCAIPDLSTITEMSKENEDNTKKFSDDTNTRNDLDSQSLFNN